MIKHFLSMYQSYSLVSLWRRATNVVFGVWLTIAPFMLSACSDPGGFILEKAYDCQLLNQCPQLPNSPQDAIADYYNLINQNRYAEAWVKLTPRFQRVAAADDYSGYENWWNTVNWVEVGVVEVVEQSDEVAVVKAKLTYQLKDGRAIADPKEEIMLVRQSSNQWLIDNKR